MRYLILVLSSLFCMQYYHAQFSNGNLKKFNVQLNVDLLNYQIKAEYAPAPRHLLSLGVGYGSIMMERGIPYSFEAKNMDPEKFRSTNPLFPYAYFLILQH